MEEWDEADDDSKARRGPVNGRGPALYQEIYRTEQRRRSGSRLPKVQWIGGVVRQMSVAGLRQEGEGRLRVREPGEAGKGGRRVVR